MSAARRIGLIGFGEVGQALAADLLAHGGVTIAAWDLLLPMSSSVPARAIAASTVRAAAGPADVVAGAELVVSAVTAGNCVAAATSAAPHFSPGTPYLDLNSVSPATRLEAAAVVEARGGRYVEAAVMSPIGPNRLATKMLLGGPHAAALLPVLHELGMTGATPCSTAIGPASATKMCRSVIVKGMEALLAEALLAGRHYGVEATVIDSLSDLFPGLDWRRLGHYMISRSLQHGIRRAEEMREAARTVEAAGVGTWMSAAAARRQVWAAAHAAALAKETLEPMLDAILEASRNGTGARQA